MHAEICHPYETELWVAQDWAPQLMQVLKPQSHELRVREEPPLPNPRHQKHTGSEYNPSSHVMLTATSAIATYQILVCKLPN